MSRENVQTARLAVAAFAARDVEAFVSCFEPAGVLLLPRSALEGGATNVAKGAAPTVEYDVAHVSKFKRGRIIALRPYLSHAEALAAVGLSE